MIEGTQLTDPRSWRLAMRIEPSRLTAMLYGADRDRPRQIRTVDLDTSQATVSASGEIVAPTLAALENAVYDTPLLLSDFGAMSAIIATPLCMAVPVEAVHSARHLLAARFPAEMRGTEVTISPLVNGKSAIASAMPKEIDAFLRRTFHGITITHPLSVLTHYFLSRATEGGNSLRLYAIARAASVDIVVLDRRRLLSADSYPTNGASDAAYYIMATLQRLNLNGADTEVFVGGETERRNDVMAPLRSYLPHVMPVIIGADLHPDPSLPFDLNVYPLFSNSI